MAMPKVISGVVILVCGMAGMAAGCHKEKPAPSIDGLSAVLQASAAKTLVAPPLLNEQVIISTKPDQMTKDTEEVVAAARAAGGAAIPSNDSSTRVSILATIPENNVDAFKAAVRHEKPTMQSPASATQLIEVVIDDAPPTPTPTP